MSLEKSDQDKPHEDRYVHMPERGAFAVFDGMGGHSNGDKAAELGRDFIMDAIRFMPTDLSLDETRQHLLLLAVEANQVVRDEAKKIKSDMGATMSMGYFWESPTDERKLITINLGDSRVYRLRKGNLDVLTTDDPDFPQDIQRQLDNLDTADDYKNLSRQGKNRFNSRNVVSGALSNRYPEVGVDVHDVQEGDEYLLTSDGVHDNLTHDKIAEIVRNASSAQVAVTQLVEASRERARRSSDYRAKPDDMTAIVVKIGANFPTHLPAQTGPTGESGLYSASSNCPR